MSTRCLIGITDDVNSNIMEAVYCQHDGYPQYVGIVLLEHYNTEDKILELMKLGDMSSIGNTVSDCDYYNEGDYAEKCTIHKPKTWTDIEYRYAFDKKTQTWWVCNIFDDLVLLEDKLNEVLKKEK